MRKSFGAKAICYPMPVFIIGTYNADGTPNAMNAAWGGISKVDVGKLRPITFDTMNNQYLVLGEKVGQAFHDGVQLK